MPLVSAREHYDSLIDEGVDFINDPEPLKEYMNKWDGQPFIEALGLKKTDDVLEIGVGTGRLALKVLALGCNSFCGVDISEKTIDKAQVNLSRWNNVQLIAGDFLDLPLDKRYDVIYSSLTFMHIEDKAGAIKKAARLLKRGGRLVISLDKNKDTTLDYGIRQIKLYPDEPEHIADIMLNNGLNINKMIETEYAVIIAASV